MENSSKALLIAGAILIVIILIGIGMLIINSVGNNIDQSNSSLNTLSLQTFNSNYAKYLTIEHSTIYNAILIGNTASYEDFISSKNEVQTLIKQTLANNSSDNLHKVRIGILNNYPNASIIIRAMPSFNPVDNPSYDLLYSRYLVVCCYHDENKCTHTAPSENRLCMWNAYKIFKLKIF